MILTDHSWMYIEQPRKMEMLFDQVGGLHFILDEAFDVEEQTILVLVQIVEANGTLQPTLDSGKSDGADGAVIIAPFWWQGMLVFQLIIVLLGRLLLGCLLLDCLLLSSILLSCLLPSESVKPSFQGFVAAEININLVLQLSNPLF
jgi:hypothetical protein